MFLLSDFFSFSRISGHFPLYHILIFFLCTKRTYDPILLSDPTQRNFYSSMISYTRLMNSAGVCYMMLLSHLIRFAFILVVFYTWIFCSSILLGFEWQITSNPSMSKSDCVLLSTQEIVFFHFQANGERTKSRRWHWIHRTK